MEHHTQQFLKPAVDDEIDADNGDFNFISFHRIPIPPSFSVVSVICVLSISSYTAESGAGLQTVRNTSCLGGRGWAAADDLRRVSFLSVLSSNQQPLL